MSTNELQEVVVAALLDVQEMRGIAQAALETSVALVSLPVPPPEGSFVLELHAQGSRPVVLLAENAGEAADGVYPLRLRSFDDEHYGELLAFVCGTASLTPQPATRWTRDIPPTDKIHRFETQPSTSSSGPRGGGPPPAGPEPDPLLGRGLAGGKYVIEALLGEGSWGAVYRARHVALDLSLAIKVLHPRFRSDPSFAKRFITEARAACRLDHPNVARVQDFGEEPDGLLYIVMELLRGTDLRELLNGPELSRERRMDILASVLRALTAADEHGIVHRDIKPENVVVVVGQNEDGAKVDVVKVCDFGLATVKPRSTGTTGATDVRRAAASMTFVAGTPEYMSPEQIVGETVDIRADLYACGVMMFELLTGRRPFAGTSMVEVLRQQLYEAPPLPTQLDPTIDPRLEALVLRALSKERVGRPASPREFREELRAAMRPWRAGDAPVAASKVGLGDLLVTLAGALERPPAPRGEHRAVDLRLADDAALFLRGRGTLTLTRLEPDDPTRWAVHAGGATTTLGAAMHERSLTGARDSETQATRMGKRLYERAVASLTLVEGVSRDALADVVAMLADSTRAPEDLGADLSERPTDDIAVLLEHELLGQTRGLPWAVDICISRLARWLGGLGAARQPDATSTAQDCAKRLVTEVAALHEADELRQLIDHADLLAEVLKRAPNLQSAEPMAVVVSAMEPGACLRVASAYLDEADRTGALAPRALVAARLLGLRLLAERSPAIDEVLSRLARRSVLSAAELPPELQGAALAMQTAERLLTDEAAVLGELTSAPTPRALAARLRAIVPAMDVLIEREALAPLTALARVLEGVTLHASTMSTTRATTLTGFGGDEEAPKELAGRALARLRAPAFLAKLAERLVATQLRPNDAASALLVHAGALGAAALLDARLRSVDGPNRAGVVAALRAIGAPGLSGVLRALGAATEAQDGGETRLLEDLLRALPDGPVPDLAQVSQALGRHGAASVRRAVVERLPDVSGPAARAGLRVAARDLDDSVRIAAFAGLCRIGAVDGGVVSLARGVLIGSADASSELRVGAAGALGAVMAESRDEAITVLREVLRPRSRSLIGILGLVEVTPDDPPTIEAASRALLAIGGEGGRREVQRRAASARPELRERLEALLR